MTNTHGFSIIKKPKLIAEKITLPDCRLKNFYRIGKGVYRSDQPSYKDFLALEKYGIKEVLNLRSRHNDDDEACDTTITLHRLRTKASKMQLSELTEALHIIRNQKGPILIHCWHGSNRTGAVCAMYRIIFQGISKQQAIDEMVEGIFGFHMIFDSIIDLIQHTNINKIKRELSIHS